MQANLLQMLVVQEIATLSSLATYLVNTIGKARDRVHHYQLADIGVEFVLEPDRENYGYQVMTAQRSGVKCGDCIVFHDSSGQKDYRVVEIDYYYDPSDMWIAKLWPCS
jgi:hypothetical protein